MKKKNTTNSTNYDRMYDYKKLKDWTNRIRSLNNNTCLLCGKTEGTMDAHHIVSKRLQPLLMYNISNGQCLCRSCHSRTHAIGRKLSDLTKRKLSLSRKDKGTKPVVQIDKKTGKQIKVWVSARRASELLGIAYQNICACMLHKYNYKSAGGYVWKYAEVSK